MIEAGLAAKSVLAVLGMLALQGTLVALLAIVLVRAGKLRPAWQSAVWFVVLAKFALPWGPALPWSLSDVIALLSNEGGGAVVIAPSVKSAAAVQASLWPALGWLALASVWAIGTAIVLTRGIARHRATVRAARAATDAPAFARALLSELAVRMRVRKPRLVVGDAAMGPFVVGALRPTIVVPPSLLDDTTLLRAALLHELAHVKRRDALGAFVQLVAVALFWWLPVVRIVSRRLELARERACDAWALESGDVSRPAYARLLLAMSQLRVAATPLAARYALDERVTAVLGPVVRPRLSIIHKLAILGWAFLALGGARSATAQGKPEPCVYTPQIAEAIRAAYPEADSDRDGVVTRDEACDFQAEMQKRPDEQISTPVLACEVDGTTSLTHANTCTPGDASR